jgi:uncharacterized phage protein (TIGR01671 family)
MREMKFRAWDKNKNIMVHVADGGPWSESLGFLMDSFEDEDLMQFTGLHDKNGKEIYEGDVLSSWDDDAGDENLSVQFDNGQWWWGDGNGNSLPLFDLDMGTATVIGNIYENPELIGKYPESFTSEEQEKTNE